MNLSPQFLVSHPCCGPECDHRVSQGGVPKECGFQVEWAINAHMKPGQVDFKRAIRQHDFFIETLRRVGADILYVPFIHAAYDSVFTKDNAIIAKRDGRREALLGNPSTFQRKLEQRGRRESLNLRGFSVIHETAHSLEGGDVVLSPNHDFAFLGYGFRSAQSSAGALANFLDAKVITLQLCDPYFYHLDTALNLIGHGDDVVAFAYKAAFTHESWLKLKNHPEISEVIEVSRKEAMAFGLNWVEVLDTCVIGSHTPEISYELFRLGKEIEIAPLSEFQLSGGSAACLTARIHELKTAQPTYALAANHERLHDRF